MRVALVGGVDSGKTQLFRLLTRAKVKEVRGNTECLRTYVLREGLEIIDCPGHQSLSPLREDAIRMCDLVVYLVDAKTPHLSMASTFADYPFMVLLNKWDLLHPRDMSRPLKQVMSREGFYEDLSQAMTPLYEAGVDCNSFLDVASANLSLKGIALPISVKHNWGVDLLVSIWKKLARDHPPTSYLYNQSTSQDPVVYSPVGGVQDTDKLADGRSVGQVFKKTHMGYILREGAEATIIPLNGTPMRPPLITKMARSHLSRFCNERKVRAIRVYAANQEMWSCISQVLSEFQVTRISKTTFLEMTAQGVTLGVGLPPRHECRTHPLTLIASAESVILLLSSLEDILTEMACTERLQKDKRYAGAVVIETDPRYVFYDDTKEKVLGVHLIDGTLKPKMRLVFYEGPVIKGKGIITSIQDKNECRSTWSEKGRPVALKVGVVDDFPTDVTLRAFNEDTLRVVSQYLREGGVSDEIKRYYYPTLPRGCQDP